LSAFRNTRSWPQCLKSGREAATRWREKEGQYFAFRQGFDVTIVSFGKDPVAPQVDLQRCHSNVISRPSSGPPLLDASRLVSRASPQAETISCPIRFARLLVGLLTAGLAHAETLPLPDNLTGFDSDPRRTIAPRCGEQLRYTEKPSMLRRCQHRHGPQFDKVPAVGTGVRALVGRSVPGRPPFASPWGWDRIGHVQHGHASAEAT
jgi:hypothetical protein